MKKYHLKDLKYGTPAVAEIELTYSCNIHPQDRRRAYNSEELAQLLYEWWNAESIELRETVAVLFLDRANGVIGIYEHSRGGTTATTVDPKLIMAAALKSRAECIVIAHNHPSGQLWPSQGDIDLTKRLATAGKLLGIPVLDHLLVTPYGGYYSFAYSRPDVLAGYRLDFM